MILDKHFDLKKSEQKISINLTVTDIDILNFRIIDRNIKKLNEFEKNYFESNHLLETEMLLAKSFDWSGLTFRYQIDQFQKVLCEDDRGMELLKILRHYELVHILTEQYNVLDENEDSLEYFAPLFTLFPSTRATHLFCGEFKLERMSLEDVDKKIFLDNVIGKLGYDKLRILRESKSTKIFLYRNGRKILLEKISIGERNSWNFISNFGIRY